MLIEKYFNHVNSNNRQQVLVLNDNISFLKSLPHNGIDFSVTSPPYDNLRDYSDTYSLDIKGLGEQLYRVMKPGGACVWVVQDACVKGSRTGTSFSTVNQWMESGWNLWDTLIYYRRGVWAHAIRFRTDHALFFIHLSGR